METSLHLIIQITEKETNKPPFESFRFTRWRLPYLLLVIQINELETT